MAAITPKEKDGKIIAYKFRVCVGRDENGRQVSRATTRQVPENLSYGTAGKSRPACGGGLGEASPRGV